MDREKEKEIAEIIAFESNQAVDSMFDEGIISSASWEKCENIIIDYMSNAVRQIREQL